MEEGWYSTWVLFPTRIGAAAPRPLRHPYLAKARIDTLRVFGILMALIPSKGCGSAGAIG